MSKTLLSKLTDSVLSVASDMDAMDARIRRRVSVLDEVKLRLGVRNERVQSLSKTATLLEGEIEATKLSGDRYAHQLERKLQGEVKALRIHNLVELAEDWLESEHDVRATWAFRVGVEEGSKRAQQRERVRELVVAKATEGWAPMQQLANVLLLWDNIDAVVQAERNKVDRAAQKERAELVETLKLTRMELADAQTTRDLYGRRLQRVQRHLSQWEIDLARTGSVSAKKVAVDPQFEKAVDKLGTPEPAGRAPKIARVARVIADPSVKPGGELAHRTNEVKELCADAGLTVTTIRPFIDSNSMSKVELGLQSGKMLTVTLSRNWEGKIYRLAEQHG